MLDLFPLVGNQEGVRFLVLCAIRTGYVRQRLGGVESKDEVLHQYRTMGKNEQKDRFAVSTNKTQMTLAVVVLSVWGTNI